MADATASATSVATGVFSRKSPGLIRVGGTLDVFIFNDRYLTEEIDDDREHDRRR
jgi:hypothetical protein